MTPGSFIRTVVGMGISAASIGILGSCAIVAATLLGPAHPWVDRCYRACGRLLLIGCSARLRTTSNRHLDPGRRYVFVSNHLSDLDSPAIICALEPLPVRFVAKEELGRVPVLGSVLRVTGNVMVSRSNTRQDVEALDARRSLLEQASVIFFAEGTRSHSGELGPFKRGAAAFALKAAAPIVPVGVHGSFEILPRGLKVKRAGTIGVAIGDPIETQGRSLEDRGALTDEVREQVRRQIERARGLV